MSQEKSGWNDPKTIIALLGLCISLVFNVIQCSNNIKTNAKAEAEIKQADKIQEQRDIWVGKLRGDLQEVENGILRLQSEMTILEPGRRYIDDGEREKANESYAAKQTELSTLQIRKSELEEQINQFLSYK